MFQESDSSDTLIESFSEFLDEEFKISEPDIFNADTFKSFMLEQISQISPPETQPIPKRPDPPKRRKSFVETLKEFKPLDTGSKSLDTRPKSQEMAQVLDRELPDKPVRKWKTALSSFSEMFKPLTKRLSLPEVLRQESKEEPEKENVDKENINKEIINKDIINAKNIYQRSYRKIVEKRPLLEHILITNFIISIVNTNHDVTLSRPKNIRKKLSRTVVRKSRGDSKKAREFLIKKGVILVSIPESENTGGKRVPGRSKKVLEEDIPLALLKQS
jgi:hypothetical protein